MIHEFNKCRFCMSYDHDNEACTDPYCFARSDYRIDVNRILRKADSLDISMTEVMKRIRECDELKMPDRINS